MLRGRSASSLQKLDCCQGVLAQGKAQDAEVKSFATMMVTEHQEALVRGKTLVQQLGLAPAQTSRTRQLAAEAESALALLKPLAGLAFDRAYIQAQVTMHTKVLALIDAELLPVAQAAALKTELAAMRTHVATHSAQAEMILAKLDAGAGNL